MASSRGVKAGNAFVEFSMRDSKLRKGLKRLEQRLASMGSSLQRVGKIGLAAGAAITGAFAAAAVIFAKTGDQLNKMAGRTGFSAQSLSELGFAAEQSGTNLEAVEKATKGMVRGILDAERGLSTATDNLDDLGLSLSDLKGKSPEEQFMLFADALAAVEDPGRRAALSMKVFGKAGGELLPLLNNGTGAIAALRKEARELGITLGDDDAQAAADLTDALNRMWRQVKAVAIQVGSAIAGPLTSFLDVTKPILKTVIDWVRENRGLMQTVALVGVAIAGAGAVIFGLGTAFSLAGFAVIGASAAIGAVGAVLSAIASPIGIVIAGLTGLAAWFVTSTETGQAMAESLGGFFGELKEIVMGTVGAISAALAGGDIEAAGAVLWAGLKLLWLQGTAGLRENWIEFIGAIVKLWHEGVSAIAEIGTKVFGNLERGWSHTTQFFGDVFDLAVSGIQKAWNSTLAFFKIVWQKIKGFFGADVQEEIDRINSELAVANEKVDARTIGKIGARDQAAQRTRQESRSGQSAVLDAIGEDLARKLKQDDSATKQSIKDAQAELENTKTAFAEATTTAEAIGMSAEAQKEAGNQLAAELTTSGGGGGGPISSAGIFGAAGLQSLQGTRDNFQERIAASTRDSAASLNRIEKKQGGGGMFS